MTQRLKEAFAEVSKLSESEQNTIAEWLLDEVASEKQWESAFAASSDKLADLAAAALAAHRAGKSHKLHDGVDA